MAENKPVPVRLRPIIHHYLTELTRAGAYGKSKAEVMRRFIENGIVEALQGGVIEKKHIADFGEALSEDDGED
jgi:hypothetical protein